jgi:RNA-directed DNA polymerase
LGAPADSARQVAANSRRWQRNNRYLLNSILTIAYFNRLGMPRSANTPQFEFTF